jgi:hypothetical protein
VGSLDIIAVLFRRFRVGQTPVFPSDEVGIWPPPMRRSFCRVHEADELDIAAIGEEDQSVRCYAVCMDATRCERKVLLEEGW